MYLSRLSLVAALGLAAIPSPSTAGEPLRAANHALLHARGATPFEKVQSLFDAATPAGTIPSAGLWIGRLFDKTTPTEPERVALMAAVSDANRGPLFPKRPRFDIQFINGETETAAVSWTPEQKREKAAAIARRVEQVRIIDLDGHAGHYTEFSTSKRIDTWDPLVKTYVEGIAHISTRQVLQVRVSQGLYIVRMDQHNSSEYDGSKASFVSYAYFYQPVIGELPAPRPSPQS